MTNFSTQSATPFRPPLELLLDFVNVKTWSKAAIFFLVDKYDLITTRFGKINGYELTAHLRKFGNKAIVRDRESENDPPVFAYLMPEKDYIDFLSSFSENLLPEKDFFEALIELQIYWRDILGRIPTHGHDVKVLNEIAARSEWQVVESKNPFAPMVGNYFLKPGGVDGWLESCYLQASTKQGDRFKRLRICENPACGKMFLFNRPKQKFCETACRHEYHNKQKIESGYLARHQAKGRSEKPEIYLLK